MKHTISSAFVLTALIISACKSVAVSNSEPEAAPAVASACTIPDKSIASLPAGMSFYNHLSHHSEMYGVRVFHTDTGVEVRGRDESPATGDLHHWRVRRNLAYTPTAITSRRGHEFYVGGNTTPNGVVLEQMVMNVPQGASYTEQGVSATPVGSPAPPLYEQLKLIRPYVEPALRAAPSFAVSSLSVPTDCAAILALGADPDGRFLLIAGKDDQGDAAVWRRDSWSGASTKLFDSTTYAFVGAINGFTFQDSTLEGRLVRVHRMMRRGPSFRTRRTTGSSNRFTSCRTCKRKRLSLLGRLRPIRDPLSRN